MIGHVLEYGRRTRNLTHHISSLINRKMLEWRFFTKDYSHHKLVFSYELLVFITLRILAVESDNLISINLLIPIHGHGSFKKYCVLKSVSVTYYLGADSATDIRSILIPTTRSTVHHCRVEFILQMKRKEIN